MGRPRESEEPGEAVHWSANGKDEEGQRGFVGKKEVSSTINAKRGGGGGGFGEKDAQYPKLEIRIVKRIVGPKLNLKTPDYTKWAKGGCIWSLGSDEASRRKENERRVSRFKEVTRKDTN